MRVRSGPAGPAARRAGGRGAGRGVRRWPEDQRGRDRARQPAAPGVRRARRPVRRRGGPRRQRAVLHRRRGPGVHGRQRRGDEGRPLGPPVADRRRASPRCANTPGDDSAIGPHGITVLGTRHASSSPTAARPSPQDDAGATIPRETLAAQNPVADLFGRVLLIGHRGRPIPVADIWDFERDVNPDAAVGNPAIDSNPVDVLLDGLTARRRRRGRQRGRRRRPRRPRPAPRGVREPARPNPFARRRRRSRCRPCRPRSRRARTASTTSASSPASRSRSAARTSTGSTRARAADRVRERLHEHHGPRLRPRRHAVRARDRPRRPARRRRPTARSSPIDRTGRRGRSQLPAGTLPTPGGITVGKDGLYVTINAALARRRAGRCASADEIDGARRHVLA